MTTTTPLTDVQRRALAEWRGFCRGSINSIRDQFLDPAPTWAKVYAMRETTKAALALLSEEQRDRLALPDDLRDYLAHGGASPEVKS